MPKTGAVLWRPVAATPSGYLLCDGSAVSRTTFAALFAVIGTTYGAGDGSTTFNVPGLTAATRFLLGALTNARGAAVGATNHTHTGNSHTHTVTAPNEHADHATDGSHQHDDHSGDGVLSSGGDNTVNQDFQHNAQMVHDHADSPGGVHSHSGLGFSPTDAATGSTGGAEPPHLFLRPVIKT